MADTGWLTVPEAAKYIGVGRTTVYEMVAKGQLAHYRVGPHRGLVRFKPSDLAAYLEGARRGPRPKVQATPPPRREYVSKYDHSKPGGPLRVPKEHH